MEMHLVVERNEINNIQQVEEHKHTRSHRFTVSNVTIWEVKPNQSKSR